MGSGCRGLEVVQGLSVGGSLFGGTLLDKDGVAFLSGSCHSFFLCGIAEYQCS